MSDNDKETGEFEEIDATEEEAIEGVSPDGESMNGMVEDEEETPLRAMMSSYFMEYASYVIKERAIPHIDDGLKPVQRRILHSLREMDDGKFHKVANVVGNTMKYHPHGDMSIYNALVLVANKEYFIEKQGNFGNIFTGDIASAARYIECRLSPLARECLFNPETTTFEDSYDGRNKEPVVLPAKVPVLLMQGTDGIAVGMSTRVLPHNFVELLQAQIDILRKRRFALFPDFFHGGCMDVSEYDDGRGKVRLRATIEIANQKTLIVREIPATTTTEALMSSIEDAVLKGKLKIAGINDFTSEGVEIEIALPRGVDPERTIQALYAYTDCEVSVSVNCLVIQDNRPVLTTITDVLHHNTEKLMDLLQRELEIELGKLEDQFHAKTLAQIFIENRIYKRIEACETNDEVFAEVHSGLKKFHHLLTRAVTDEDVERLLQIPIRRISLFDINKNKKDLEDILARMDEVKGYLANMRKYTIDYLTALIKKYGDLYPRHTRIEAFEQVNVREIALNNIKVALDRSGGYLGTAVKAEDPILCTEFDKLVVVNWNGTYKVISIPDKLYVGSVCTVMKMDKARVYSILYRDRKTRLCYVKRFRIDRFIMDKEYQMIPAGCKIERMFERQCVILRCEFEPVKRQKEDHCEIDFDKIPIRGAAAKGYKVTDKKITKFLQIRRGTELGDDLDVSREPERDEGAQEEAEQEMHEAPYPQPPEGAGYATVPNIVQPSGSGPRKKKGRALQESADEADDEAAEKETTDKKTTKTATPRKSAAKKKGSAKSGHFLIDEEDDFTLE